MVEKTRTKDDNDEDRPSNVGFETVSLNAIIATLKFTARKAIVVKNPSAPNIHEATEPKDAEIITPKNERERSLVFWNQNLIAVGSLLFQMPATAHCVADLSRLDTSANAFTVAMAADESFSIEIAKDVGSPDFMVALDTKESNFNGIELTKFSIVVLVS